MDTLVVYYSIFGNNEGIATNIAQVNNYDIVEFNPGTIFRVFQFFKRNRSLAKKAQQIDIEKYRRGKIPRWNHPLFYKFYAEHMKEIIEKRNKEIEKLLGVKKANEVKLESLEFEIANIRLKQSGVET